MCDARRRIRPTLAAAIGAAALTAPLWGQSTAELRQRIERLNRAYEHASATRARADSLVRSRIKIDTIRVGAFRIVAGRSVAPRVSAGTDSAWRVLTGAFGQAASAVSRHLLVVQLYDQAEGNIPMEPSLGHAINLPSDATVGLIAQSLIQQGSMFIREQEDTAFSAWLLATWIPASSSRNRLSLVYEEMVTSLWTKARGCYVGDLDACRAALGLRGREDPILGWYDAADRREMVRAFEYPFWKHAAGVMYDRCYQGGPDAACEAALRAIPPIGITTPLSGTSRLSLLETAFEIGGAEAYDRFRALTDRPIEARFVAAARLPGDSLLSLWRGRVLAARPRTVALGAKGAWTAVVWGTILGFLALRSTRWR